ncbi:MULTISPECIES: DUF6458 family protein [unclassified Solwaraspora]|uniref:DUF6458 family protein n=1 Tax=unclassified Solwaraspora TaxID=2627926 RepID=UPI00259B067D|nr:DUF6458 family protein [Solwaraspora sp. WMMA2056]WJK41638.1 DUF6458 family protein [Solwaraspora sp. WMMA2056]
MGIGGSIFLVALGAILAFAVEAELGFLNLNTVGWVLMAAGVFGLILTLWFWQSRRRSVVTRSAAEEPAAVAPPASDHVVEEQYREVRRPGRPV